MLQIQTLLSGLPEEFDSLKTQMRATPALTISEINTRVLNEDAAIRAISTKAPSGQQALRVGDKGRRNSKSARITVVLIQKDTYLKNVGSSFQNLKRNSRPRSGIPMVMRARKLHPAPDQKLTHGASKV